ncbi:MAG: hypothetical protein J6P41_05210 [Prevotella sp.]|nr:hypothetical protein [Prevotella sp.]
MKQFKENVILADADYIDRVAFDLTVNFERMIGRQIPKADIARWADCVALDGGLREGDNDIQVVLIHDKQHTLLKNFVPSDYGKELNGQAFKDHLGEFVFETHPVEDIVSKDDFLADALQMICSDPAVKRIMVIPDSEDSIKLSKVTQVLRQADDEKRITLFAMQPLTGCQCRQEILGYSLMAALGIRGDEIKA